MENIENIKRLVDDLASINRDLERKPNSFLTRLQVDALEKRLYENSGIKVKIENKSDFKKLEEYYLKLLSENAPKLEESKADKPKERSSIKVEFETQFNIGDRVKIKLKLGKPRIGRILAIFYTETADPWEEYPKGFDTIVKKVMYRVMLDDMTDREMRDLEARHYLPEDLELIQ